jgi:FKBP-type peptidyl-prolyl cis-trans isomerase
MANRNFILPLLFIILLSLFSAACKNNDSKENIARLSDEQLVNVNRELVIKERERIESYISRKGLDMNMTDAGIWYSVIKHGEGDKLGSGDRVRIEYSCSLLDGTLCYSSDSNGDMNITIGSSDIPSGLDEALRLLKAGSRAIIILPSNMAYGLVGDGDRIPARAALIYEIMVYAG